MPDIPSTPDSPANGGRQLDQLDAIPQCTIKNPTVHEVKSWILWKTQQR